LFQGNRRSFRIAGGILPGNICSKGRANPAKLAEPPQGADFYRVMGLLGMPRIGKKCRF
jgi:hypothetical protein